MEIPGFDLSRLRYPLTRTIRALGIFFFIQGLCFGSWAGRIPDIKSALGLGEAALGSILFMLPMGQLSMMPFSGRIAARFGTRNVLRLCLAGYAATLSLIGNATEAWQLGAALYLFGLVGNLCNISVNTQGVNTEALHGRPVFTIFHGLWSLGGFSGAVTGLLMARFHIGPAIHFACITAIVITGDLLFQRFLIPREAVLTKIPPYRVRLPQGRLLLLGSIAFCCMSVEGCMFDWTGVYFKQVLSVDPRLASSGYAAFMITMTGGRFFGRRLIDRFGREGWVQTSGLLVFGGLLLIVLLPYLATALLGCILTGMGVSTIIPLMYGAAGKDTAIPSSIAIATVGGVGYLGFLMGPPVIGYIAEWAGLPFSFLLMSLCGIAIFLLVRRAGRLD